MSLLLVNPILTLEQLSKVREAARLDPNGHDPRFATDVVTREGEIIGALAICSVTLSNVWIHSEKCRAADSMMLINIARSLTHRCANGRPTMTMCSSKSPLLPFMEKFGFLKLGESNVFEERSVV